MASPPPTPNDYTSKVGSTDEIIAVNCPQVEVVHIKNRQDAQYECSHMHTSRGPAQDQQNELEIREGGNADSVCVSLAKLASAFCGCHLNR